MDDISIDLLVQFLNVTTTFRLGSECASVSLNKFKLMLSCNPALSLYLLSESIIYCIPI
jgi:hypothetical protein